MTAYVANSFDVRSSGSGMVIPIELDDHLILYCVFARKFGHVSRLKGMVGHLRELVTDSIPLADDRGAQNV